MESLLAIALSNAAVATLMTLVVAVSGRVCRRPAVRHALWLLVLLKLVTPSLVPLQITWPQTEEKGPPRSEPSFSAIALSSDSEKVEPVDPISEPSEAVAVLEADPPSVPLTFAEVGIPLVTAVWLGGSFAWWMIAVVRLGRFHRLLREARPASAETQEQARRLAALLGLRRCPPVAFVSAPLSPVLWALGLSPRLLLPAELWPRLDDEQRDTLLAHELAHLRRGDHWVRRLEFLVLGLYWWHPVVWWARRRLQEAEEECCDARVVAILPDAAPAYAAALVETVTFLSQTRAAALVGASGAGQVPLLKRRLTMILTAKPSSRSARAAFWAVLGLGVLFLPLAPGLARPEAPDEPQREEAKDRAADKKPETTPSIQNLGHFHLLGNEMQKCTACHQPAAVHSRDLQRKPQSWREAHDEIVRLMDEMRRLQSGFREAADRLPTAAESNRDEQIEKLRDELELLKLQVQLKEGHLRSAKVLLTQARRYRDSMQEQNKRVPGSVSSDEVVTAANKVDSLTAEVEIKGVELQEAQVRLNQAQRRLGRLQQSAGPSPQQLSQAFSHDFGTVKHGSIVHFRYALSNGRGKPLRIASVRSSSAALSAKADKREIEPGRKGTITVSLDTGRFIGSKTFTVFVQFEEGQPEMRLEFHAISQASSSPSGGAPAQDKQAQLKEVERKLQDLLKEVRDLQHEKRPVPPRDPNRTPDSLPR
jgi:beta-lactamase regulating signal transducer with metallopeptidase domain